ncbi:23S rRNA (pseudouridine(1915)-N(3))-methyltransferase RlmH [Mycoplasma sp. CSL10137]|uniref:23S rRNA (pseudouridine(1915)-N(3))-methyltransferase RlmH n=1 Tax=unclassified Mycoplasma TaxID=2683645 RepID=UPI00197B425C|nr:MULTISPECIES: 23S rRNA (pseudouridine(1915)-N(3))-methyltransferase RlmH [unclassified Mycoplasma]MBN4083681.1 23S rRNA (pseudouridine(1915)-N(3))-methyltransferase RlmH [Mycoplasma sp. CSL10137]MBU4693165.1 23S rRNA (pseudouridine(1915)-N(3))-methyltransferase RlmH [Mycoplasma sp. CSL7491-lung]
MKLNIVAVGSLSKEYQVLFNDYLKKVNFFAKVNLIEIKEQKIQNIELKKQKETELILEKIPKNSQVIYLSTQAKQVTSEEFSERITNTDNITFVIGGSNGVIETYFSNKLNFSKMTFPHQLFRVMLIEQIYRAFTIKNGITYHK